jgi:hypothetical protein
LRLSHIFLQIQQFFDNLKEEKSGGE